MACSYRKNMRARSFGEEEEELGPQQATIRKKLRFYLFKGQKKKLLRHTDVTSREPGHPPCRNVLRGEEDGTSKLLGADEAGKERIPHPLTTLIWLRKEREKKTRLYTAGEAYFSCSKGDGSSRGGQLRGKGAHRHFGDGRRINCDALGQRVYVTKKEMVPTQRYVRPSPEGKTRGSCRRTIERGRRGYPSLRTAKEMKSLPAAYACALSLAREKKGEEVMVASTPKIAYKGTLLEKIAADTRDGGKRTGETRQEELTPAEGKEGGGFKDGRLAHSKKRRMASDDSSLRERLEGRESAAPSYTDAGVEEPRIPL